MHLITVLSEGKGVKLRTCVYKIDVTSEVEYNKWTDPVYDIVY